MSLKSYFPIAEAIACLLKPHAEVILHDLKSRQIAGIFNNFSKRKVGGDSLLEEDHDFGKGSNVLGPFPKMNWDGRKLKSITSVIRDSKGIPFGLMCINLDISSFDRFQKILSEFLSPETLQGQPNSLFQNDWMEKVNSYIELHLRTQSRTLSGLSKNEQCELVQLLHQDGAFEGKNAASYIGQVLGISRATVYNYLRDIKK